MYERILLHSLKPVGANLHRPECVLATASGHLCTSDWRGRGGVGITDPGGRFQLIEARGLDFVIRPNGIALMEDGSFLLAHLGDGEGGLYRLWPDGRCEPVLTELDGKPLPPSNFPCLDASGRIWLTISTRHMPRAAAYRRDISDGFIVLLDEQGARIAADGLGYSNECAIDAEGRYLYVNETFGRRISRFSVSPEGELGERQTFAEFGYGTYPDGLTFDANGDLWITSIISNRVIHVDQSGTQTIVIEDVNKQHLEQVEEKLSQQPDGSP